MVQMLLWSAKPRFHSALHGSKSGRSLSYCTSPVTFNELREICPAIGRFGTRPVRGAINRVDEAYGAFFRRKMNGENPGYPRFKSWARFRTIFYDEHRGWALPGLTPQPPQAGCPAKELTPALYVQGVGEIPLGRSAIQQLRRLSTRGGEPRTLTITRTRSGTWRACVGFRGVALKPLPRVAISEGWTGDLGHRCPAGRHALHVPSVPQRSPGRDR
jgi:hypothetical protein